MPKLFVGLFLMLPLSCFAQYAIKGRVINISDKKPIAGASVFLANSSTGSVTTDNGAYILNNIRPGKYNLIVSVIGFSVCNLPVDVNDQNVTLPDIELYLQPISLNEVQIKAKKNDPNRQQYLDWFEQEFLGTTELGTQCKILNPDVLNLDYDLKTNILTVSAYDLLQIENASLGYKLKYLLKSFILNNKDQDNRQVHFDGSVFFEAMNGTPAQERKWKLNRQAAYEGSEMHFLRSALNNQLDQEGFRVLQDAITYDPKKSTSNSDHRLMSFPLKASEVIKPTDKEGIYTLGCEGDGLYVSYNRKHHFATNDNAGYLDSYGNTGSTMISFTIPFTVFNNNGSVITPNNTSFRGVWGRDRVGGLLPADYWPQNSGSSVTALADREQNGDLVRLEAVNDSLIKNYYAEKIYLQFDKPAYAIGDTIWLKAWLLNASTLELSPKSAIINVDIANEKNVITARYRFPVKDGLSWGNITIDSAAFKAGTYTLRAYTTWMRNFSENGFYYKQFTISDPGRDNMLVNMQQTLLPADAGYSTSMKLQFADINKTAIANSAMQLQVSADNKKYYDQKLTTDAQGRVNLNIKIRGKSTGASLIALSGDSKAVIPINLDSIKDVDVQFLPEGGALVAGLPAHIGFKAVGEDGRGIDVSGIIIDQSRQEGASFRSLHNGMGSFNMLPKAGETYEAKVTLPNGTVKEYPLPAVNTSGTVLQVRDIFRSDSVQVFAAATDDIARLGKSYFLIAKGRGEIRYSTVVNFHEGYIRYTIPSKLFESGIVHIILTTTSGRPLNERLVYIDHHDNLNVRITSSKAVYASRDSVAMHIKVTNTDGDPVEGNFSLVAVDDGQVLTDTLKQSDIINYSLLSSDLNGYVENPGYYLFAKSDVKKLALDNLLLTQGWVKYDWPTDKKQPDYPAENGYEIKGQVLNAFNKPLNSIKVDLFSKSPILIKDTITNKEGEFTFTNFPRIDTPVFFIETPGRHLNEVIKMAEPVAPPFNFSRPVMMPWYVNSDDRMISYTKNRDSINKLPEYSADGAHRLREVKIIGQKIIKGSKNLNGTGNADIVLDEKDMEQAGKKTWLQILQEKVKGFREGTIHSFYSAYNREWFFINDKPVRIIIDGVVPNMLLTGYNNFPDFEQFLKSHTAEDISGIEVLSSTEYAARYATRFGGFIFTYAFIEITTRTGGGMFNHANPGTYLFKPVPLSWPKEFYKPKYNIKDSGKHLPDLRSTIDWEPNIITDQKGEATVSFYSADKPGTYTIIVQGTDGRGGMGYGTGKISISDPMYKSK